MSLYEHLGVIRATGSDAVNFLHSQLSNDLLQLPLHQWQLAAYCSPKGRVLASVWALKINSTSSETDVALVLSKDILAQTLKRLSMFVLRAKVSLVECNAMLADLEAHYQLHEWAENEVERGVARITSPLVDLFVPQMLNFESIGGISFKKGCYPGQEVVARSQFRGAIKRRTYRAQLLFQNQDLKLDSMFGLVGQEIIESNTADSVGMVLQVTHTHDAPIQALVCLKNDSIDSSLQICLTENHTIHLKLLDLPYKLLTDI